MALYRYFKLPDDVLPSPTGDLSPVCLPGDNKGAWLIACAKREILEGKQDFHENWTSENFLLYGMQECSETCLQW